jgi:ribonuclease HII
MSSVSRELAETGIRDVASAVGIGWVSAEEVDSVGLTQAVRLAMWRALDMIDLKYDSVIIDGNFNFLPDEPRVSTMVKADALVPAVSAASIVAKVARDRWMAEASQRFPGYGFERHVGYGTRQHTEALRILGPCELHRRSFRPVAAVC